MRRRRRRRRRRKENKSQPKKFQSLAFGGKRTKLNHKKCIE
jgi:hypothetical protein